MVPQGGEVAFGTWPYLMDALSVFKDVGAALAQAAGVVSFFEYFTAWMRRQDNAANLPTEMFDAHNAGPVQVKELLVPGRITLAQVQQFLGLDEARASSLVLLFGFDISEDGRLVFLDQPDARFQQRLLHTLVHASTGDYPPDAQRLADFARARLEAFAQGKDEPSSVWAQEWNTVMTYDVPADPAPATEATTMSFRVIALRTDNGVDPIALEQQLNAVGKDGFYPYATLEDQPLSGGGRGWIFIFGQPNDSSG